MRGRGNEKTGTKDVGISDGFVEQLGPGYGVWRGTGTENAGDRGKHPARRFVLPMYPCRIQENDRSLASLESI